MIIVQVLLLTVLLPLSYGPIGHAGLVGGGPNILLVSLWLFGWLTNRSTTLNWAILAGLSADLLGFHRFGLITLEFLLIALLIDYVRRRFFQVSSLLEALVTLVVVSAIDLIFHSILSKQLAWESLLISILANVVIGAAAYYVVAIRFRLFARWAGKRL